MAGGQIIRGHRTDGSRAEIRLPHVRADYSSLGGGVDAERSMSAALRAADIKLLGLTPFDETDINPENGQEKPSLEVETGRVALDGIDILKEN